MYHVGIGAVPCAVVFGARGFASSMAKRKLLDVCFVSWAVARLLSWAGGPAKPREACRREASTKVHTYPRRSLSAQSVEDFRSRPRSVKVGSARLRAPPTIKHAPFTHGHDGLHDADGRRSQLAQAQDAPNATLALLRSRLQAARVPRHAAVESGAGGGQAVRPCDTDAGATLSAL